MTFNTKEEYILEDERALLRPLTEADQILLLPYALHEPHLWKFSLQQPIGADGLERYMLLAFEGRNSGKEYPFIVYDKQQQQYAGSTRFYDIELGNKTLQLGYTWYGSAFHGTGLNKHCKFLLLQFAFEKMDMMRVEFRADKGNAKSIAAMKSIGCIEEGVLRSNGLKPDGSRRDSIVLSILKNEWEGGVKERLAQRLQ